MTNLLKRTAATLMVLSFLSLNVWADEGHQQCPKSAAPCLVETTTENPAGKQQKDSSELAAAILKIFTDLSFLF